MTDAAAGYNGIWFALGQFDGEHGDKYSGGLGTYTMKHVPTAVYAPAARRTFFVYGASPPDERDLQIAAAWYDHDDHEVCRPRVVDPKPGADEAYGADTVVDPHDNAALALDGDGHVWVFVSGRGRHRPGRIYRSRDPHDVRAFERVAEREMAYPQPWRVGNAFHHCFTKYTDGRELYWERGDLTGEAARKLAGFGGHYQVTERDGETVWTAFNWHPGGDVDRRTNCYVLRTADGETWTTADGSPVETPLTDPHNPALVRDYRADDRLVYLKDLAVDEGGRPALLYLTSDGAAPGPTGDPRTIHVAQWNGRQWETSTVARTDHNYDAGSLYVDGETWRVVAPTEPGPRPHHTGGEVVVHESTDGGASWTRARQVTADSDRHHTYVRRPRGARDPFAAFWADGDPAAHSESRLYFAPRAGDRYYELPRSMHGETATPVERGTG